VLSTSQCHSPWSAWHSYLCSLLRHKSSGNQPKRAQAVLQLLPIPRIVLPILGIRVFDLNPTCRSKHLRSNVQAKQKPLVDQTEYHSCRTILGPSRLPFGCADSQPDQVYRMIARRHFLAGDKSPMEISSDSEKIPQPASSYCFFR
jgi:hypothetical protein